MEIMDAVLTLIKAAPHLAIWVLVILYGFKVAVVGSIYAVIRFVVDRVCTSVEKHRTEKVSVVHLASASGGLAINDVVADDIKALLSSFRQSGHNYIHESDVDFVRKAIAEKRERDAAKRTGVSLS